MLTNSELKTPFSHEETLIVEELILSRHHPKYKTIDDLPLMVTGLINSLDMSLYV